MITAGGRYSFSSLLYTSLIFHLGKRCVSYWLLFSFLKGNTATSAEISEVIGRTLIYKGSVAASSHSRKGMFGVIRFKLTRLAISQRLIDEIEMAPCLLIASRLLSSALLSLSERVIHQIQTWVSSRHISCYFRFQNRWQ